MAVLAYQAAGVGLTGAVLPALAPMRFTAPGAVGAASGPGGRDWRFTSATNGTITVNNRVMVKPEATAPEVPMPGARVRLHRLLDGYCAWEGISDAQGYYWPRGLEVGLWYYPVAIDLTGTHECDAAGPVQAVKAL